jgi:hypothetical protein
MNRLTRPVSFMRLESSEKFYLDCPIDVYPGTELRRIEVPRELARYVSSLQDEIASLERRLKEALRT